MEEFQELVKPELLILVPVLSFLGAAVKRTGFFPAKFIPLTLGAAGVLFAVVYVFGTCGVENGSYASALFTAVTQGLLCASMSVYFHQIVKQKSKKE
ncbi:MAG: phage holin family protein [Oscillospiraceae bacterium]|nr:phage holin family protein [Oscillospiraceae bacterium]